MHSKDTESKPPTLKEMILLFSGGAGAGLIAFALFGGVWQVSHFWWVLGGTTTCCGLLAIFFRQNFEKMLNALMDNAPWL